MEYGACSVLVNRTIRNGLPSEIKQDIPEKLEDTLTQASDYAIDITFIMNVIYLEVHNKYKKL